MLTDVQIVWGVLFGAVAPAAVTWLTMTWIQTRLKSDIDAKNNAKLEQIKSGLNEEVNKRLEQYKISLNEEANKRIEQHKSTLNEEVNKRIEQHKVGLNEEANKRLEQYKVGVNEEANKRLEQLKATLKSESDAKIEVLRAELGKKRELDIEKLRGEIGVIVHAERAKYDSLVLKTSNTWVGISDLVDRVGRLVRLMDGRPIGEDGKQMYKTNAIEAQDTLVEVSKTVRESRPFVAQKVFELSIEIIDLCEQEIQAFRGCLPGVFGELDNFSQSTALKDFVRSFQAIRDHYDQLAAAIGANITQAPIPQVHDQKSNAQ